MALPNPGWTVNTGDTPSQAKWRQLGENDDALAAGTAQYGFYQANLTTYSKPYKFSVYASTGTVLGASVTGKVILNSEHFDTNNNFDSTTNYRYSAPVTGFYFVTATVQVAAGGSSAVGNSTGMIFKNGTEFKRGQMIVGSGNTLTLPTAQITDLIQLAAGDYIELFAYNGDAGSSRTTGLGSNITYMSGFLVCKT